MLQQTRLVRCLFPILGLGLLLFLSGCGGGSGVPLKGKLVLPQGLTLADNDTAEIVFVPEEGKGRAASATVDPKDGTFTAAASGKKGVLPGKYKISVRLAPYLGAPGSDKRAAKLEPINKQFSRESSTLNYEVTSGGEHNITVDLAKGSVSKN